MTHDPREVPQITMADIRKHTGEGMVSEQSVIDAANEVLKEIYTSPPPADRREIVARALMEKWPGDYAWGDETREPNELAFETADAILAALDGGAGA